MKLIPCLLLAGSLFAAAMPAAHAADLLTVYREAMSFDAQFAAARAALTAGREKLPQGLSGLLPSVGFGASTTWNDTESTARVTQSTSERRYNSNGWSLTLTQPVFLWQNLVSYRQAERAVAVAEAQFAVAGQELIVRVAQAYFDVLLAQDALTTAQAQKTAIAEQLEAAKRNFEVGTSTITDTHEAQARYDLVIAQEIAASNDLSVKRHAFQTLIGKEPDAIRPLKPGVALEAPQPADMNAWVTLAETAAIPVQLAREALEIARHDIDKQRGGHYPTLDLVATHGRSAVSAATASTGGAVDSTATTLGLQLSLPLYAGGGVSSRQREAVALRDKALADLDHARRSAALGTRQAYLGVTSGLAQVRAYEAALTSSQSALDSNKLGYEVGVRINIDVLNAQSQLYDTRQKLSKARLDTLAAQLRLKAAVGTLAESDLVAINALLQ